MSHLDHKHALAQQTQQLLQGPLKRVAAAGLAAALVPLASVAVVQAEPRSCASGGNVCGMVWSDTNNNGVRDAGELPIVGAVVTLNGFSTATDSNGFYQLLADLGTHQVIVQIPPGTQVSPANVGADDTIDSDGISDGLGNSIATITLTADQGFTADTDFGFWAPPVTQVGTGTPGYWKNHPEAWPVDVITLGGVDYTKTQALAFLDTPGKDKSLTMFSSLVSAKLNVMVGNDPSCVASTIEAADAWMATYPAGSDVRAASLAWKRGEPLHRLMDNYNNGMLCAPHRD
jgi:SdrD B-like protein